MARRDNRTNPDLAADATRSDAEEPEVTVPDSVAGTDTSQATAGDAEGATEGGPDEGADADGAPQDPAVEEGVTDPGPDDQKVPAAPPEAPAASTVEEQSPQEAAEQSWRRNNPEAVPQEQ